MSEALNGLPARTPVIEIRAIDRQLGSAVPASMPTVRQSRVAPAVAPPAMPQIVVDAVVDNMSIEQLQQVLAAKLSQAPATPSVTEVSMAIPAEIAPPPPAVQLEIPLLMDPEDSDVLEDPPAEPVQDEKAGRTRVLWDLPNAIQAECAAKFAFLVLTGETSPEQSKHEPYDVEAWAYANIVELNEAVKFGVSCKKKHLPVSVVSSTYLLLLRACKAAGRTSGLVRQFFSAIVNDRTSRSAPMLSRLYSLLSAKECTVLSPTAYEKWKKARLAKGKSIDTRKSNEAAYEMKVKHLTWMLLGWNAWLRGADDCHFQAVVTAVPRLSAFPYEDANRWLKRG